MYGSIQKSEKWVIRKMVWQYLKKTAELRTFVDYFI